MATKQAIARTLAARQATVKPAEPRECLHCGNTAPMNVIAKVNDTIEYGDPPYSDEDYRTWHIMLCPSCRKPTLEEIFRTTFEMDPEGWPAHVTTLYPTPQASLSDLPNTVKVPYEAALRVRNVDPNAFAVLVGRLLEVVCADREAKGETLAERLNDLSGKGEIPGRLAEMAQSLRLVRNIGAHAELGEVAARDVPVLLGFCESILDYLYRAPAKLARIQKSLKRSNAGRRAGSRESDKRLPGKSDKGA